MLRQMQHRLEELVSQFFPVSRQRLHQRAIRARILVQLVRRKIDISVQAGDGAVIERMRQRNFGLDPIETEPFEWKRFEEWRTGRKRMNCRTNIVNKTWQRQFG